jgi:hypothetical protein
MFKLEWALSRTIIYAVAVVVAIIMVALGIRSGVNDLLYDHSWRSIAMWFSGLVAAGFSVYGMIRFLTFLIDKYYYYDWYDYRRALGMLESELAGAITEKEVVKRIDGTAGGFK